MIQTAQFPPLGACKVLPFHLIWTFLLLEGQWIIQVFNQCVAIRTVKLVWAVFPVAVFAHVGTSLRRLVEEETGWSSEVLLSVREVTVTPLMLLVNQGTE